MNHKQHFLLSAQARTLSVRQVFAMSDEQAFDLFRELRWGKCEETVCPTCGSVAQHYFLMADLHIRDTCAIQKTLGGLATREAGANHAMVVTSINRFHPGRSPQGECHGSDKKNPDSHCVICLICFCPGTVRFT